MASVIPSWPIRSWTSGAVTTCGFTAGSSSTFSGRSAGGGGDPSSASWPFSRTSGLLHEYLFLPVDRKLLGWQLAFFLVHGLGAVVAVGLGLAYARLTGRRAPRTLAVLLTLAFVLLSAPLFIHCLDHVADLHRGLGAWVLRVIAGGGQSAAARAI